MTSFHSHLLGHPEK